MSAVDGRGLDVYKDDADKLQVPHDGCHCAANFCVYGVFVYVPKQNK